MDEFPVVLNISIWFVALEKIESTCNRYSATPNNERFKFGLAEHQIADGKVEKNNQEVGQLKSE